MGERHERHRHALPALDALGVLDARAGGLVALLQVAAAIVVLQRTAPRARGLKRLLGRLRRSREELQLELGGVPLDHC